MNRLPVLIAIVAASLFLCGVRIARAQQEPAAPDLVRLHEDQPADRPAQPKSFATRNVTIENISGRTVDLRVVEKSCPVLTVVLERDTLAPGESTPLRLAMPTAEVGGRQTYTAKVEARSTDAHGTVERQSLSVSLAYTLEVHVVVHPNVVTLYAVGDTATTCDLALRDLDGEPVNIDQVLVPGPWVRALPLRLTPHSPSRATVTLESTPMPAGLYRGTVGINAPGQPEGKNLVNLSLRVDPALTPDPPGVIWRHTDGPSIPRTANVTFVPNRFGRSAAVPFSARLTGSSDAIQVGDLSRPDPAQDRWVLSLRFDPAKLGDSAAHGSRTIEVLDAAGAVLCTVPVLWFSDAALRAP